ncbi:MAG: Glutamate dehydrogenase, partial [Streblomastix strix]
EGTQMLVEAGVIFLPGKAANAGGVATSGLEMAQSSGRMFWDFEDVDAKLRGIMKNIFLSIDRAARDYGFEGNYVMGANIVGFLKVASAMIQHGIV